VIKKGKDIKIISIEKRFESKIKTLKSEYKIRGIIDRIDEIDGRMRIIDYKTGKKLYKYNLKLKNIKEIRNPEGIYNLQLLFYMVGVAKDIQDKVIEMGIMSIKNMKDGVLTAMIGNQTEYKEDDLEEINNNIVQIIEEILNKDIKFEN
jgi:ATP-dependent exoDNAse (exonuclease V) beta subunit